LASPFLRDDLLGEELYNSATNTHIQRLLAESLSPPNTSPAPLPQQTRIATEHGPLTRHKRLPAAAMVR